jgi:hypothetical protein
MKKNTGINIIRWIVGLLFIFSGMIKANDPLGLSYKMQEFFVAWNIHWFDNYTLALSLIMNVFEVLAGVAVIVGWRMKLFTRLLLLLIVFFGFLTGYALLSGKIKECGCFGDCLPMTDLQSFLKDVFLFLLILVLVFNYKKIQPLFKSQFFSTVILIAAILFVWATQFYVLKHLPVLDCLPYKVGKNIPEEMKMPAGARPDSVVMMFKYKKDGKEIDFDANHIPDNLDSTYIFVDRYDKVIKKGDDLPLIPDFYLRTLNGNDTTLLILNQPNNYVLMFTQNFQNWDIQKDAFAKIENTCKQKNVPLFIVTSSPDEAGKIFHQKDITILTCDNTIVRTAARVDATYFLMQQGNILLKKSYADADDFITQIQ